MSDAGEMFSDAGEDLIRSKRSIKKIFGKPKLKKDGTPGKTMILPPVEEIQEDEEQRQTWIEYSALDAQATWFLRESLEAKLRGIDCEACPVLSAKPSFRKSNNLWEFYTHYLREFAEVLTDMESAGMFVDKAHLARAETQALADKKKAEETFRAWAIAKCPAAEHMNVGSGIQVRQLLFAGAAHKKRDKPGVERRKAFAMTSPEWIAWDAGGREGKAPKKGATFELYGITERPLRPPAYTPSGLLWSPASLSERHPVLLLALFVLELARELCTGESEPPKSAKASRHLETAGAPSSPAPTARGPKTSSWTTRTSTASSWSSAT